MRATPLDARPSGIPTVGELPWGSHFGVFYASPRELLDLLVPFLRAGLECNELCTWEVEAPLTVDAVTSALAGAVPELARHLARGQLEVVSAPPATPGPPEDEALERRIDRAILAGFDGVRMVARTGAGRLRGLAGAESRLTVIAAFPYPRSELGVLGLMERVQDHRFAVVSDSGRWKVLEGSVARAPHDALRRTEDRLQSLFRNMSEGFAYHRLVRDEQGRPCDYVFLDVNPAFERLTGLAARDVLGRRVTQVIPQIEKDPTDWIGRYGRVALTGEPAQFESHALALDRWYAVSAFSSQKGYFAVSFADITDRKRAEEQRAQARRDLREANERLQEADRRKDEFLAVLSHELRNPLAPIRNSLYILDRVPPSSEQAARALRVIRRQAGHLSRIVDDLLDVTRIVRGKIRLRLERVDVVELVRRTAEDYRASFGEAGLHLEALLPDAGLFAQADPTRLAQIVGNLLGNALKFTPRNGSVVLELTEERGAAALRVRDDGIGMAPGTLARLFQPFSQAEQSLDRNQGGLGLGLTLVKSLAELHGGTAWARSEGLGRGSEVTVTLPLDGASSRPEPATGSRPARRCRVLVVEDNVDAADSLREVLELWGHEVRVAHDGPTGIALARELRPELVLCDIGLPGTSGYAVARALRADGIEVGRLVALTGYAAPDDVHRAKEAGFDGHLAKPPDLEALEELLAAVGSSRRRLPAAIPGETS